MNFNPLLFLDVVILEINVCCMMKSGICRTGTGKSSIFHNSSETIPEDP